ncbi:MAG TPA: cell division protein ZapB [Rectinemataceae bacterium]
MVSLEQIRALEARVEKAVGLIEKLRRENADLERDLIEASRREEALGAKVAELEAQRDAAISESLACARKAEEAESRAAELLADAENLRKEQGRIEEGLSSALAKLDAFEDLVMGIAAEPAPVHAEPEPAQAEQASAQATTPDPEIDTECREPQCTDRTEDAPLPGASFSGTADELDIF